MLFNALQVLSQVAKLPDHPKSSDVAESLAGTVVGDLVTWSLHLHVRSRVIHMDCSDAGLGTCTRIAIAC